MSGKANYKHIAQLEVEIWGKVFTKEAKQYDPVFMNYGLQFRRGVRESETTLDARARDMDHMLCEYEVE